MNTGTNIYHLLGANIWSRVTRMCYHVMALLFCRLSITSIWLQNLPWLQCACITRYWRFIANLGRALRFGWRFPVFRVLHLECWIFINFLVDPPTDLLLLLLVSCFHFFVGIVACCLLFPFRWILFSVSISLCGLFVSIYTHHFPFSRHSYSPAFCCSLMCQQTKFL